MEKDQTEKFHVSCEADSVVLSSSHGSLKLSIEEARVLAASLIESAAELAGLEESVENWRLIPMQYLRLELEAESEAEPGQAKAAEVHCWIKDQSQTNAFHVAVGWASDDGWIPTELLEHREVNRDDFEASDFLRYYEQALLDNEVFLYELEE